MSTPALAIGSGGLSGVAWEAAATVGALKGTGPRASVAGVCRRVQLGVARL